MYAARIALLLALVIAPPAVRAGDTPVSINCLDAVGIPGGIANVEVVLIRDGEALVATTQNDLGFDSTRFSLGFDACVINPAIGPGTEADKELAQNVLSDPSRLRALILNLGSVNVIPPGLLYTCPFQVASDVPLGTYDLTNGNAIAATADGTRLPVSAGGCRINVAAPTVTPTPTPRCREDEDCPSGQVCVEGECVTPTPTRTPTGCRDDDDCPQGQVCVNDTCVTPTPTGCRDDDDCPQGQVCVNDTCVTPTPTPRCRNDMDCPSGQVCVNGMCENATPTATPTSTRGGGGGDGCNCEIDPAARASRTTSVLAVLLPALVLLLRRRARRPVH
jgi:MYXO-CTERM domain-containing protein